MSLDMDVNIEKAASYLAAACRPGSAACRTEPAAVLPPVKPTPSPVLILLKALSKIMPKAEAEALLQSAGMQLPAPAALPASEKDFLNELRETSAKLEAKRASHAKLLADLGVLQQAISGSAQIMTVLEEDVLLLKRRLLEVAPTISAPDGNMSLVHPLSEETKILADAFGTMAGVITSEHTMLACYEACSAQALAEGKQPMEKFAWMAQQTQAAMSACVTALAAIRAACDDGPDSRGRPRKTPRTADGTSAAADACSSILR